MHRLVNWNQSHRLEKSGSRGSMQHIIHPPTFCDMPISTTRRTTQSRKVVSILAWLWFGPQYCVILTSLQFKSTECWNPLDTISNHAYKHSQEQFRHLNHNTATYQPLYQSNHWPYRLTAQYCVQIAFPHFEPISTTHCRNRNEKRR